MADLNGVMMQYFHWYIPADGTFWEQVKHQANDLAKAGITALWLPPAYKASGGGFDVGYGAYDLFDLGEFDQKGSVRTKYGTRDQLLAAIKTAQAAGIQIYADCVFNHKNGGDEEEEVDAYPVSSDNRNYNTGGVERIKIWTHFTFPGRGEKYSSMKWHWWHFDSVNHNMYKQGDSTVYRFKDKQFETQVDPRHGNYDFLMACDLDTSVDQVQGELKYWGEWFLDTTGVDGFRLDAVKHVRASFFKEWLGHVRHYAQKELFTVGEYWSEDMGSLDWFIRETSGQISLFDVPLHYNFHRASRSGGHYDMRRILDGTLMQKQPTLAVTFVDNHDSQPLQALESVVESWFKPLAYALILLRREGYPCVFYADYYGADYRDRGRDGNEYGIHLTSHRWLIDKFLFARKNYAYGDQYDYFDHFNTIGWTRLGNKSYPKAMAVIMSDGPAGHKWMEVGKPNATFRDITEHIKEPVQTNEWGWGEFRCKGGSVSVWVQD
ncbi:alpha-amylase [Oscillatoria sp. FACHB-1407]|uniref:alpha-amylase n=1 Tax=Oscillatoria sp. FACHB-1407 TaxID=2692847 RepID=UPI001689075D|nr:alpha-amylase [Oscillatoria sp. FACHB-1407]MBD2461493.1 alpha-amylase [Oscillatoria sp. FACHB-1407]